MVPIVDRRRLRWLKARKLRRLQALASWSRGGSRVLGFVHSSSVWQTNLILLARFKTERATFIFWCADGRKGSSGSPPI